MTMIEKVARAIAMKAVGADVWDRMASTQRAMFRAQAIAALTALLEPDEAMIVAGARMTDDDGGAANERAKGVLWASVQAALASQEA